MLFRSTRFFRTNPVISIGGADYPTAPPVPKLLTALMFTPLLGLVFMQGIFGVVLVILGIELDQAVLRSGRPVPTQLALMGGVLVGVLGVALLVATAFG